VDVAVEARKVASLENERGLLLKFDESNNNPSFFFKKKSPPKELKAPQWCTTIPARPMPQARFRRYYHPA
jgi:hypothetical protein